MSSNAIHEVQELVKIMRDSAEFYREARQKVSDNSMKAVFNDIAGTKERMLNRLQPLIVAKKGEAEDGHSWSVKLRQMYTSVMASLQDDNTDVFINNLEEVEDKIRAQAHSALNQNSSPDIAAALRDVYPDIKHCHDEMSRLKTTVAH